MGVISKGGIRRGGKKGPVVLASTVIFDIIPFTKDNNQLSLALQCLVL